MHLFFSVYKIKNQLILYFNRSELVGTAGVVKIHYDGEAPSPTPTTPASVKRFVLDQHVLDVVNMWAIITKPGDILLLNLGIIQ